MSYLVKPSNLAASYARLLSDDDRASYETRVKDENAKIEERRKEWDKGRIWRLRERQVSALENIAHILSCLDYRLQSVEEKIQSLEHAYNVESACEHFTSEEGQ